MNFFILITLLVTSNMLYGKSLELINKDAGEVLLEGKNESCQIVMTTRENIVDTNCTYITNFKNIDILCTAKKTTCKTVEEIDTFLYGKTVVILRDR